MSLTRKVLASVMWNLAIPQKFTYVSKEHNISFFRAEG
jgi:hypothetical protein